MADPSYSYFQRSAFLESRPQAGTKDNLRGIKRTALGCLTNSKNEELPRNISKQKVKADYPWKTEAKIPPSSFKVIDSVWPTESGANPYKFSDWPLYAKSTDVYPPVSSPTSDQNDSDENAENIPPMHESMMECHEDDNFNDTGSPCLLDDNESNDIYLSDEVDEEYESRVDNLIAMTEYKDEIYAYLRECELKHRPLSDYMRKHAEIAWNMRSIMVDWMVEVVDEFKQDSATLFLSVDYVDRFLSRMFVTRNKLQLVGTSALFIAGKFEEIYPPGAKQYAAITDNTYTVKQIITMEHLMLKAMNFEANVPTTNLFCEKFLKEAGADDKMAMLARYLCELSLLFGDKYLKYLPSIIAASSIYLANYTLGEKPWTKCLQESTLYTPYDFASCVKELHRTFFEAPKSPYSAIRTKYQSDACLQVGFLTPPEFLHLE